MLTDLQAALVDVLDEARLLPNPDDERFVVPLKAAAYGGELLVPERLLNVVPAVFVELDQGSLERIGDGADVFQGDHRADVICAARNAVSVQLASHEGARLMAWVVHVLGSATVTLGGEDHQVQQMAWGRLGMDAKARVWSGVVRVYFDKVDSEA